MGSRRRYSYLNCSKCVMCKQFSLEHAPKRNFLKQKKGKSKLPATTTAEAALRTEGSTNDVYEDVMLYVRDEPVVTRSRGRPRKLLPEVANPPEKSAEIIFVPSVKPREPNHRDNPYSARRHVVSTVKCAPSQLSQPCHSSCNLLRAKPYQQELVRAKPNQQELVGAKPNQQELVRTKPNQQEPIDWPDDLKWLVDNWDDLPEKQLRDTVKWLTAPLADKPLPEMVENIHREIEEWDETDEKKIEQIGAWLLETPSTPTPPKVVVQAEPEQNGQWSSLQDQKTE